MGSDDNRKNPWGKPGNDDRGPWSGKGGSNRGGGNNNEPPDIDEMLRRAQDNFRNVMPGGFGSAPIILLAIVGVLALWLASGFYVVNPGENAVIQKFGAWSRTQAEPGLGYHLPSPIETATIINTEEIQKMNIGFVEAFSRNGATGRRDLAEESLMLTSDSNIIYLYMNICVYIYIFVC